MTDITECKREGVPVTQNAHLSDPGNTANELNVKCHIFLKSSAPLGSSTSQVLTLP